MLGPIIELFSRVSRGTAYIGYKRSETDGEQAISYFTKFRYPVSYGGTAPNFCRFHEQGVLPLPPACSTCVWEATGGDRQEVLAPPAMELSNKQLLY